MGNNAKTEMKLFSTSIHIQRFPTFISHLLFKMTHLQRSCKAGLVYVLDFHNRENLALTHSTLSTCFWLGFFQTTKYHFVHVNLAVNVVQAGIPVIKNDHRCQVVDVDKHEYYIRFRYLKQLNLIFS